MIAQVDEQHAAVVADAVAPAGQADVLADIDLAQGAAGMGSVTMHGIAGFGLLVGLVPNGPAPGLQGIGPEWT
jgi:hypothetical protein